MNNAKHLAKFALTALQSRLHAPEKAPIRNFEGLAAGTLDETEAEAQCRWLLEHPEDYELWLTKQAAPQPSRISRWWAAWQTQPLIPATALGGLALAVIISLVGFPPLSAPPPSEQLANFSQQLGPAAQTALRQDLRLPHEQPDAHGFAATTPSAEKLEFTRGVINARKGAPSQDANDSTWYRLGVINVLLTTMAYAPGVTSEQWAIALNTLATLPKTETMRNATAPLAEHVSKLEQAPDDNARRRQLRKALSSQRDRYSVPPQSNRETEQ